ncbi:MAG: BsuPI-related putative proteinase inhibitor [Halolamina sp.]
MLETDIEAEVDADGGTVRFRLTVRNRGDDPAELSFRSSQRVEVTVRPADSGGDHDDGDAEVDPVWRASEGRMYAQMLDSETVAPDDARTYEATWESPPAGSYRVKGEVVAADRDLTATTTVSI